MQVLLGRHAAPRRHGSMRVYSLRTPGATQKILIRDNSKRRFYVIVARLPAGLQQRFDTLACTRNHIQPSQI